jgi:tyrosyl-tRNA synthetase
LSDKDLSKIKKMRSEVEGGKLHPMDAKKSLAAELVGRFHGAPAARSAEEYFEARHQKKELPKDIKKHFSAPEPIWICRLMVDLGFAKSSSEARRLIAQGAVKVDGEIVRNVEFVFDGNAHEILEVGKNRIAQVETSA